MSLSNRSRILLPVCVAVLLSTGYGQTRSVAPDSASPQVQLLRDSIKVFGEQIDLLQHFLEASTVDPAFVQYTTIRSWVINNPTLRDSLFYALLQSDSSLQTEAGSDAEVLATRSGDLIQVRFGTAIFKGVTLKKALDNSVDKSLYEKVADSYLYSKDIELRDPSFRLETPLQPELLSPGAMLDGFYPDVAAIRRGPINGFIDMSIDRFTVKIGPRWGGEVRLGVDEINNPFWANGTVGLLATYKRFRFGLVLPVAMGTSDVDVFPPILFRARRLTGARGFIGDFDLGPFGGLFSVTRFSSDDLDKAPDPSQLYFVAGIVNLYYSFGVALDPANLVRAKVGLGVHRVTAASAVPDPNNPTTQYAQLGEITNLISPYIKIEYLDKNLPDRYKASVQFYNMTLMFTGALEIVRDVLSLEAKYVWPIGGDIHPWEYPEFFTISPVLRIVF
jgi:hypothetical protein